MIDSKTGLFAITAPYRFPDCFPDEIVLGDHLGGFDSNFDNSVLQQLDNYCRTHDRTMTVHHHTIMDQRVLIRYPRLQFKWMFDAISSATFDGLQSYRCHPRLNYQNFLCSFNGSDHVSRKLLTAMLHRRKWFDPSTCSKNFACTVDAVDGHIADYIDNDQHQLYRALFIGNNSQYFFDSVYSFGHVRHNHASNITNLEQQLTQSFVQVVSESMATSYHPFVTEKFLYSVVTRGLFVAYAQPNWHQHLEKYFGFQLYRRIFDYSFDTIENPVKRLVALADMLSKYADLSVSDWHSLYEMEKDTVEYNYHHYFSGNYLNRLQQHV